jgi:predicted Rossmann-fold nucleotide-binding protein
MIIRTVACFGSGKGKSGEFFYDSMAAIGRALAEQEVVVATGGYGGSGMEAPIVGANEVKGSNVWTVGYVLACRRKDPNQFLKQKVVCGKDLIVGSNSDAMQYAVRLGSLLDADAFVVDCSDETLGTLIEFASVLNMNQKFWTSNPKPVALLMQEDDPKSKLLNELMVAYGFSTEPWIRLFSNPEKLIQWLLGFK